MILQAIQAHNEAVRGVCVSPTDLKFATASDDSTLKVPAFLLACINTRHLAAACSQDGTFRNGLHVLMKIARHMHPNCPRIEPVIKLGFVADLGLQKGGAGGNAEGSRRGREVVRLAPVQGRHRKRLQRQCHQVMGPARRPRGPGHSPRAQRYHHAGETPCPASPHVCFRIHSGVWDFHLVTAIPSIQGAVMKGLLTGKNGCDWVACLSRCTGI